MSDLITSVEKANKYSWGQGCVAWQLVNKTKFYVVEEVMPPTSAEIEHHHNLAQQFFYVLDGVATFYHDGKELLVKAGEGIYIEPGIRHKVSNQSDNDLRMLIVSTPPSLNDRHE
ncbi:MAG: cupin domain-containing protein [Vicingaceae bacterium]